MRIWMLSAAAAAKVKLDVCGWWSMAVIASVRSAPRTERRPPYVVPTCCAPLPLHHPHPLNRDIKLENVLLKVDAASGEVLCANVADLNAIILAPGETTGQPL